MSPAAITGGTNIRINLLPWREEMRREKRREFLKILVAVIALASAIMVGIDRLYGRAMDLQAARNVFLMEEISILEGQREELGQLQQNRNQLLARMQVIRELQDNRTAVVRMLDELARRLAPGVFFTGLDMQGERLAITGAAQSNDQVSQQLRNFAESDWFANPNVTAINADISLGPRAGRFELTVTRSKPGKQAD